MDPFSKWVEIHTMPSLHSRRVAEFLHNYLVARWANYAMSRATMVLSLWAALHGCAKFLVSSITHPIGNSKANRKVEQTIRTLKDCIWRSLTKMPATFWTNHLASALLLLCMTASRMTDITPYLLATGQQPLLPRITAQDYCPCPTSQPGRGRNIPRQSQLHCGAAPGAGRHPHQGS